MSGQFHKVESLEVTLMWSVETARLKTGSWDYDTLTLVCGDVRVKHQRVRQYGPDEQHDNRRHILKTAMAEAIKQLAEKMPCSPKPDV